MSTAASSVNSPQDGEPTFRYNANLAEEIEIKWQDIWEKKGIFNAADPAGGLLDRNGNDSASYDSSYFVMDMFPFPSGAGLHVGHPLGYIATDVVGRFERMNGKNVLHALGFDSFGLPTEQYAIETGQHPRVTTENNIANMRRQLRRMGLAHDQRRTFATTDPEYFRWTQWIFLQIFNSWFDVDATGRDGAKGVARPISELEAQFASGQRELPAEDTGKTWAQLPASRRREILNSYRLAYVSTQPVNWCPGLGTVLANEEVNAEGRSERGNFPVFQRNLQQWNMRITAYADRLEKDLAIIDWPEKVKSMQENWIGRSIGARVKFAVAGEELEVFTTRPDTLFGVTFMVVAPEHPILEKITDADWPQGIPEVWKQGHAYPKEAVANYRYQASRKSAVDRQKDNDDKTGVFTGLYATNPVTGAQVPVFTADYVLMGYGTGAIMAVPGGDERDFEFAEKFELPVIYTVAPPTDFAGGAYSGVGEIINSSHGDFSIDGLSIAEAKTKVLDWLIACGLGEKETNFRLRDWLFSRQRYWGEPFPIVYDEEGNAIALPETALPVLLPEVADFQPKTYDALDSESAPEPPLGRNPEWVFVELDLGDGLKTYRRETNTMPNWAGSCWYYLRYLDPTNNGDLASEIVSKEIEQYWLGADHNENVGQSGGVDLYVGGVEHAVLHLLYARFWHKVLFDLGFVSGSEPFHRLFNQGYIQAYAYTVNGSYVPAEDVVEGVDENGQTQWYYNGELTVRTFGKMGKSLKNIVTPDDMYEAYGADTFRIYEMSMGPLDMSRPWETKAVVGAFRFLQRLWRNFVNEETGELTLSDEQADLPTLKLLHKTIRDVREEMKNLRINTAIARLIQLNNHLTGLSQVPFEVAKDLLLMLAPIAPHISEELWQRLGHTESIAFESFPSPIDEYLVEDNVTCVFQVQGKVRGKAEVSVDISDADLEKLALENPNVIRALEGRGVRKVIVRAPKLVSIVPQ